MHNWQRIFAFVTGSLVFGLLIILLSRDFIQYTAREGTTGFLFLLGFALIFLNLNFGISRRYTIKAADTKWVCLAVGLLTVLPTVFWTFTKDVGLEGAETVFVITVVISAFSGAFLGIRRGLVKREKYLHRLREEQEHDLPRNLKRPHDDLSKN